MTMSIKVVLADDHAIVRDGVRAVLERKGKDMEIVAEIGPKITKQMCMWWIFPCLS